jgi:hypothetical protein
MNYRSFFKVSAIAIAVLAVAQIAQAQVAGDGAIANMTVGAGSVRWDIVVPGAGGSVTVSFPDGRSIKKSFRGGSAEITLSDKQLEGVPDGVYNYEVRVAASLTAAQKESLLKARGNDDDPESERNLRKRPAVPSLVQHGSFALFNGSLVGPGAIEGERTGANSSPLPQPKAQPAAPARVSANTITRLRNHRVSLGAAAMFDFVIADDLIVQGSTCTGLDCVNGEVFNFDTLRLKENNTRIGFMDTSVGTFPSEDWTIRANSSANGGGNFLAFVDQGTSSTGAETGTIVFEVDAGAPANSLRVSSGGKIGIRTATPVLDVHVNASDTPAFRMEQNNSGGFTAQTWDIGANEANWFVRDVTGGSRLPFRIRPGAPTSSIDISATGNVGIGTASPASKVEINTGSNRNVNFWSSGNYNELSMNAGLTNGSHSGLTGGQTGDDSLYVNAGNNGDLVFRTTGTAERMRVLTGGNVGIGTAAPDQKLSVNGDADKAAGGGSWGVFSDERLKDIKGGYGRGLSAVMGLQPLRFSYKKNNAMALNSDSENIGFSAQELQKIIPEAVTTNAAGYLMVHNDPILWTMLNAIKEQQKEIESLKSQVAKLKATSHRRQRK